MCDTSVNKESITESTPIYYMKEQRRIQQFSEKKAEEIPKELLRILKKNRR